MDGQETTGYEDVKVSTIMKNTTVSFESSSLGTLLDSKSSINHKHDLCELQGLSSWNGRLKHCCAVDPTGISVGDVLYFADGFETIDVGAKPMPIVMSTPGTYAGICSYINNDFLPDLLNHPEMVGCSLVTNGIVGVNSKCLTNPEVGKHAMVSESQSIGTILSLTGNTCYVLLS